MTTNYNFRNFLMNLDTVDNENYFDNASTTRPSEEAIEAANYINTNLWANPNNKHSPGLNAYKILEESRALIADAINAYPSEIYFTSSASESNAIILGNFTTCYCSKYEHHDIIDSANSVVLDDFNDDILNNIHLNEDAVFAHMMVNNETGQIFNVENGCDKIHNLGFPILIDATQAIGNIEVDVKDIGCDFLSFSCHKAHGLKVGVLYISSDYNSNQLYYKELHSIITGTQENNLRGGTQNVADIYASAIAVSNAVNVEMPHKYAMCYDFKKVVLDTLKRNHIDFLVNEGVDTVPSILNVSFKGISGDSLMLLLNYRGFTVSTGSACNSGNLDPSYVLKAMEVPDEYLRNAIRISFSTANTLESVRNLANAIVDIVKEVNNT